MLKWMLSVLERPNISPKHLLSYVYACYVSFMEMDVEKTQHFSQAPVKVRFNNNIRSRDMESDCKGDECKVSVRAYTACCMSGYLTTPE